MAAKSKPIDNSVLPGSRYRATHKASVVGILGSRAPRVESKGNQFYNRNRWTCRVFIAKLCDWAKGYHNRQLSDFELEQLVNAANAHSIPRNEKAIVIAQTPDKLPRDMALALIGGGYHEAWHTQYSCTRNLNFQEIADIVLPRWHQIPDWSKYAGILLEWSNIIEDIRIERLGCKEYPGTVAKMHELQDFVLRQEMKSRLENPTSFNSFAALSCAFRDMGLGYNTEIQAQAMKYYIEKHTDAVQLIESGPLRHILDEAIALDKKDDTGCLRLALDVIIELTKLSQQQPPPPPPQQSEDSGDDNDGEGQASDSSEGDSNSKPQSGNQSQKESKSKSEPDNKKEPNDSERPKPEQKGGDESKEQDSRPGNSSDSEEEQDKDDDNDSSGSGDSEEKEEEEKEGKSDSADSSEKEDKGKEKSDSDSSGSKSSEKEDEESNSEDGDSEDDEESESDDEESESEEDGESEGDSDSGGEDSGDSGDGSNAGQNQAGADQSGSDSQSQQSGSGSEGSTGELGNTENPTESETPQDGGEGGAGGHHHVTGESQRDLAQEILDQAAQAQAQGETGTKDYAQLMEETISDLTGNEMKDCKQGEKPWRPYTLENDEIRIVKANKTHDLDSANRILAEVREQARYLRARFRTLLRSMEIKGSTHGLRRGKGISERFLVDSYATLRNGTVPKRAYYDEDETIDMSLAGAVVIDESGSMSGRLSLATAVMMAITEPLDSLGCKVQVSGFRDGRSGNITWQEQNQAVRSGYHRADGIIHDVFKTFEEPFRNVKQRFAKTMASGGTPMSDGVQFGLEALSERQEAHRILFVITDGQPNGDHIPVINHQLRMAKDAGIHVIGVGIGSGAEYVRGLFPDSVYHPRVDALPKLLVDKLNELIEIRSPKRGRRMRKTS